MGGAPAVAPGLLIAERYRVETLLSADSDVKVGRVWRAYDEVLARPVAMLLVPDDDPGVPEVLAGARAAARLTHAAVVRVYDAGAVPGIAFIVTEFLSGGSLEGQLLTAPLEPGVAVDLVADLAIGVAAAHDVGLHGLSLTPRTVLFTATGAPRLTGIALADDANRAADHGGSGWPDRSGPTTEPDVDGAAHGAQAASDAVGLARLLYAALTARWPGPASDSALPAAPYAEGHLRTPRQVRGGVPREVDSVVSQALGDDLLRRGLPAIDSPAAFAAALAPLRTSEEDGHPYGADTQPIAQLDIRQGRRSLPRADRWRRWAIVIAAILVVLAIGALLIPGSPSYLRFVRGAPQPAATPSATSATAAAAQATGLSPHSVTEFDPYGDHTDPHVAEVPRAFDGDPATAWRTQTYRTANLGNLKPGVGLLIDFGKAAKVGAVHLRFVGSGTSVTLFDSNADTAPANEKEMTVAAAQDGAPADVTLRLTTATSSRYWVIWLTKLPAAAGGFQGGVAEMSFLP